MVQDLFTAAKVFALVIIILAGIVWLAFGHTQQLEEPLKNTDWSPGNYLDGINSSFFASVVKFA